MPKAMTFELDVYRAVSAALHNHGIVADEPTTAPGRSPETGSAVVRVINAPPAAIEIHGDGARFTIGDTPWIFRRSDYPTHAQFRTALFVALSKQLKLFTRPAQPAPVPSPENPLLEVSLTAEEARVLDDIGVAPHIEEQLKAMFESGGVLRATMDELGDLSLEAYEQFPLIGLGHNDEPTLVGYVVESLGDKLFDVSEAAYKSIFPED